MEAADNPRNNFPVAILFMNLEQNVLNSPYQGYRENVESFLLETPKMGLRIPETGE